MISSTYLLRLLSNIIGSRFTSKIIVFESDDWGSIRMPSREVYEALLKRGIRVDQLSYNRYDSLASEEDLSDILKELLKIKDKNGHPVIFTLNTVVANPDFEKIKESDFTEYHYEPFTETLKRYPKHHRSFALWEEGISAGVFKPQYHSREHLNVPRWMKSLRENIGNARLAFNYKMLDLSTSLTPSRDSFMDTLNFNISGELKFQQQSIVEGTDLFEQIFGYRSSSFIAPCYMWSSDLNETIKSCGIGFFQGGPFQLHPTGNKLRKILHYTGQQNSLGQYFFVRNVSFEPSENPSHDWVGSALSQISQAFQYNKPAIISTHRMNYIGFIDPENRRRNLLLLRQLLGAIKKKWPDIEFISSDQLGDLLLTQSK